MIAAGTFARFYPVNIIEFIRGGYTRHFREIDVLNMEFS
jgi:hypothetical protein